MTDVNPLIAQPPTEVPLKNPPIVRAIAQVRFPPILSIEQKDFVASFQEAIRVEYPILEPITTQSFIINPEGAAITPTPQTNWCFWNVDRTWRISLASSAASIETTKYTSRTDFLARLEDLLVKLHSNFYLSQIDRVGLRYINRVIGHNLEDISLLIRPEIAGIIGSELKEYVHQVLHESLFLLPEGQLSARWGIVPENTTFDPYAIDSVPDRSWILDLDLAAAQPQIFNAKTLVDQALSFTERIYTFFRWAVTDEFLRRYGGEL